MGWAQLIFGPKWVGPNRAVTVGNNRYRVLLLLRQFTRWKLPNVPKKRARIGSIRCGTYRYLQYVRQPRGYDKYIRNFTLRFVIVCVGAIAIATILTSILFVEKILDALYEDL